MSFHQVRLRKDGPIHAVEYAKGYSRITKCGMYISPLDEPVRRIFPPENERLCARCLRTK